MLFTVFKFYIQSILCCSPNLSTVSFGKILYLHWTMRGCLNFSVQWRFWQWVTFILWPFTVQKFSPLLRFWMFHKPRWNYYLSGWKILSLVEWNQVIYFLQNYFISSSVSSSLKAIFIRRNCNNARLPTFNTTVG